MPDDLVTWLREQIAEDKRVAQEARKFGPVWSADPLGYVRFYDDDDAYLYSVEWPERAAHIALHDPAAVLAQCEAHEMILTLAETVYGGYAAVQALGLAYRHRPGYREEWRP